MERDRRQGQRRNLAITHRGKSVMWISHSLERIMLCIWGQEILAYPCNSAWLRFGLMTELASLP